MRTDDLDLNPDAWESNQPIDSPIWDTTALQMVRLHQLEADSFQNTIDNHDTYWDPGQAEPLDWAISGSLGHTLRWNCNAQLWSPAWVRHLAQIDSIARIHDIELSFSWADLTLADEAAAWRRGWTLVSLPPRSHQCGCTNFFDIDDHGQPVDIDQAMPVDAVEGKWIQTSLKIGPWEYELLPHEYPAFTSPHVVEFHVVDRERWKREVYSGFAPEDRVNTVWIQFIPNRTVHFRIACPYPDIGLDGYPMHHSRMCVCLGSGTVELYGTLGLPG
jgi:hypothetical protein